MLQLFGSCGNLLMTFVGSEDADIPHHHASMIPPPAHRPSNLFDPFVNGEFFLTC